MTVAATRVLKELESLSPDEQVLVCNKVVSATQKLQLDALNRFAGLLQGRDLVGKLLAERKRDKERE
jgi:hypothetical protein